MDSPFVISRIIDVYPILCELLILKNLRDDYQIVEGFPFFKEHLQIYIPVNHPSN